MQLLTQIMAFTTAKLSELPLRSPTFPVTSHSLLCKSARSSPPPHSFSLRKLPFSSLASNPSAAAARTPTPKPHQNPPKTNSSSSAPWLNKWPPLRSSPSDPKPDRAPSSLVGVEDRTQWTESSGGTAIDRILHRLRKLELGSDDDENDNDVDGVVGYQAIGEEKLDDLLNREWIRPDTMLAEQERRGSVLLPWAREEDGSNERKERGQNNGRNVKAKAPTLAELTIESSELRRLRREGMVLRDKINVAKAGVTQAVLEKIHQKWRNSELVRLKFHESLTHDMKTAHEIVERRTGGLVIWRSGSVMVVYRGSNYEGPASRSQHGDKGGNLPPGTDVTAIESPASSNRTSASSAVQSSLCTNFLGEDHEDMTQEEVEYNDLLDGLGPRFVDWWGTGILPVDADLLPQTITGFKPPLRLLPVGVRAELTDAELTSLRKLTKSLPCHFALGRNRNHQGLASAIIRLWEKSLVAKIAVKQGIQNTNNKLMAEEIKRLTGGVLLMRNKYYITIYRGKDFLPTSVAAILAERQERMKNIHDTEEQIRNRTVMEMSLGEEQVPVTGTLADFYEAQERWGREISTEERNKMIEATSRAKTVRKVNQIQHKLSIAQAKKHRAEKLLAKIEASMMPVDPFDDQETITDEERFMFRRVGLSMKAYLPLGIRGIFDGVVENMHLHWKHRELVKLITKQKILAFVEETARLLEYESGGILIAIERTLKGYALIYYRGKNYCRPISIRPRNLLTKGKALKRAVAMQRHEALSQHIHELEQHIEQMKLETGDREHVEDDDWCSNADLDNKSRIIMENEDEAIGYSDDEYGSDSENDDVDDSTSHHDSFIEGLR